MNGATATVNGWHGKLFQAENDPLWSRWVDFELREASSLCALLASGVRDDFRGRALTLLLTPDLEWVPFHWKRDVEAQLGRRSLLGQWGPFVRVDFGVLEGDLLAYGAAFLCSCARECRSRLADVADAGTALDLYDRCFLQLLRRLPEGRAGEIADCYAEGWPVTGPTAFGGGCDDAPYHPPSAPRVPDACNERADTVAREALAMDRALLERCRLIEEEEMLRQMRA